MKQLVAILLFFLFPCLLIHAQEPCGTTKVLEALYEYDSNFAERRAEIEKETEAYYRQAVEKEGATRATITIPVVFHVIYNREAQNIPDSIIHSQMEVLNEDFSGLNVDIANVPDYFSDAVGIANIEFCLASRDPNGNPSTGITRKETSRTNFPDLDPSDGFDSFTAMHFDKSGGVDAWDTKQYLNIWVCNVGTTNTLAWAYLPGADERVDGIVCRYEYLGRPSLAGDPYSLGRTLTHEVGHWLNLFHTFDNDGGNTCSQDFVEDTPSQRSSNFGCPNFPRSTCKNHSDMFMNYMDYTDDDCGIMFTKGQVKRMEAALSTTRKGILNSIGCTEPANHDAQISNLISPIVDNCLFSDISIFVEFANKGKKPLNTLNINYQLDNGSVNVFQWEGELAPQQTTPAMVGFASLDPGLHHLVVYTSLPNGEPDAYPMQDTLHRYFYVGEGTTAPFFEDFNTLHTKNAWTTFDSGNAVPWHYITTVSNGDSIITGAMGVNHYFHVFFDGVSTYDELVSPSIDLRLMNDPYLVFDYSYHFDRTNEDDLQIFASTDCNQTREMIYHKKGDSLSTRFYPALLDENDWSRDTVDLADYAGESIILTFKTTTAGGSWLFIDNILVDGIPFAVGSSSNPTIDFKMEVYPNPCTNHEPTWVSIENSSIGNSTLRLFSTSGEQVLTQQVHLKEGNQKVPLSIENVSTGLYFLEIIDATGRRVVEKLSVQE